MQAETDLTKAWMFLSMEEFYLSQDDDSDVRDDKNPDCFVDDEEWLSSLHETFPTEKSHTSIQLLYHSFCKSECQNWPYSSSVPVVDPTLLCFPFNFSYVGQLAMQEKESPGECPVTLCA